MRARLWAHYTPLNFTESNYESPLLQGGLYSIGCPDTLRIVAGCVTLPLSKAGQLVQKCPIAFYNEEFSKSYACHYHSCTASLKSL